MDGRVFGDGGSLDDTGLGDEEEVIALWVIIASQEGDDGLVFVEVEEVNDRHTLAKTAGVWDLITSHAVNLAQRGEEEDVGMGLNVLHELDHVAGNGLDADDSATTAMLGIEGVFASTSLKAGEDWRWQTHLANLPVYYEFKNNNVDLSSDATKKIAFQYDKEFKNIFDLYLNDSVVDPKNVGVATVDQSMAEFALEESAMVQNGNWAWGQISGVSGNKVLAENVKYLPIYTGVPGEEGQGLCIGTENFYCINKKASAADQKATADFIYWLYSSATGKNYVTNKLGFIAPFDTFADNERPTDPLAVEINNWMSKPGITSVAWNFTLFPSQTFKDNFGASLLRYAQGSKDWADVKAGVVSDWESESAM